MKEGALSLFGRINPLTHYMSQVKFAPIFIMIAATLWAVDALFRTQLTYTIPSTSIVMIEHAIGFLILSPLILRYWNDIKGLKKHDWMILLVMTIVSSVLGTVLFTEALGRSFAEFDFVTPILLQKLQPLFVVALSALILKEHISVKFIVLAIVALVGSYLISFGFNPVSLQLAGKELVFILAIGAAASWGTGTILSKHALNHIPFPALAGLRMLLAVPIAYIFSLVLGQAFNPMTIGVGEWWRFLVIAGITGGALAIYLYYKGLQKTPARVSTFAELMFPVASIFIAITPLNPYGAAQVLSMANVLGIVILLGSVLMISFMHSEK